MHKGDGIPVNVVTRELRVAFSRRAQPLWIRLVKWPVLIGITWWVWRTPFRWAWLIGAPTLGLTLHFFYRWKTRGWTLPWGGWDDVEAGRNQTKSPRSRN